MRFELLAGDADGFKVAGTGSFRGAIEVRRNGRGLAVVNDLPLEEYVRGIDEVPPSWPAAALQAQAIAARTYAAHKAMGNEARWRAVGADICATSTCQVYRGLDAERRAHGHGWLPAVEATAGRALIEGGRPIMASYSSTANGPRAMSQNGALAMAREGHTASDILANYYGLRPTPAAATLPPGIKVAVVMSTSTVRLTSPGLFRVIDGAGTPLATGGAGEWSVVAAGDGVRLVPPETYA
ncbi:MAG: SpoIID/LytB domain-containing protein, partial [Acidimicrobiales bacterium]